MRALLSSRKVPRSLIYESQARRLIGGNVPLLAPGREGNRTNPDPGNTETGLPKLPFDPLGSLKPGVVCRRQLVEVAEQLQQSWIVATGIPRQCKDRRRGRHQSSQENQPRPKSGCFIKG